MSYGSEGTKLYVGNLGYDTTSDTLYAEFGKFGTVQDATVATDRETGGSRGFGFVTFGSSSEANAAMDSLNGKELDGRTIRVNLSQPRERDSGGYRGGGGGGGGGGYSSRGGGGGYGGGGYASQSSGYGGGGGGGSGYDRGGYDRSSGGGSGYDRGDRGGYDRGDRGGSGGGGGGSGGSSSDSNKLFIGNLGWNTTTDDLHSAFGHYGQVQDAIVMTDRETGSSRGFGFVTFDSAESARSAMREMDGQDFGGRNIRVNISEPKRRY